MQTNYSEALVEVNEILKFTDSNLVNKIPEKFKSFITSNMSKTYKFTIPEDDTNINLKQETKAILALIYRNYFCSESEKNFLINQENLEQSILTAHNTLSTVSSTNTLKTEHVAFAYDNILKTQQTNKIFENQTKNENISNVQNSLQLVQPKQKWYIILLEKLLKKLKSMQ